jgi:hypothetical protein
VDAGSYTVALVRQQGGSAQVLQSRPLTVLKAPSAGGLGGAVIAAPNPVSGGGPVLLHFEPAPGLQVEGQLFDLAGEAVGQARTEGAAGALAIPGQGLASGPYVAVLRFLDAGRPLRQARVKVAVLR